MFAELVSKTNFSFLRGASHPGELIQHAHKLGVKALAINDFDGVYGLPKAYFAAKDLSIKLISAATLRFSDHPSLMLLATDRKAYGILCRLLTASHHGKPKGEAHLSWKELSRMVMLLKGQGLIALCAFQDEEVDANRFEDLKSLFPGNVYLPLCRYLDGKDKQRTEKFKELSHRYDVPLVATNDVHYHIPQRRPLQDAMTATREGVSLKDAGFRLFSNGERYLKSPEQMEALFKDVPEALSNTMVVADKCTFCLSELRYYYPSEWIPSGYTAQSYLEEASWKGIKKRYPEGVPEKTKKQMIHELSLIKQLNFPDYFLTIFDIVNFARSKDILCQGRGSAANSVVCYALGITSVNPNQINLLFERFISAERGEPPDIDVDFEHERREEVIQYIYNKYGRHRAAMVSAVVTYQRRSAFRELSKSFGIDVGTLSAKKVKKQFDHLASQAIEKGDLPYSIDELHERLDDLAKEMKEFPRHLSIHSGGFTLSAEPIIEIVPVEPARMEDRTIIQWDKYDLDYLGLLKIDVLSLGMLSALKKALDEVGLQFHEVPQDDPQTYDMIQKADTIGTFQIESRAQMSMLGRLLPKNFYDLVIEIAIVRPGPIVGKMVHPYLKRRWGDEEVFYPDPRVKEILGKTMGIPLFQEQVMKLAMTLADFSAGEADQLRRAIGAWRSSGSIEKMGKRLMEGLLKSGMPEKFAVQMYEQIQGFAGYGFPESHSASFALIAYASCYIKCHHPAVFAWSVINSQPMGFYPVHTLVDDAKRHGVEVFPLDPHKSQWDCTLENGGMRMGWRVVHGFSEKYSEKIEEERAKKPFQSIFDFIMRTRLRRDLLERLAMGDVFRSFGFEQREALWRVLEIELWLTQKEQPQLSLLSYGGHQSISSDKASFKKLGLLGTIQEDYGALHMSTHGHPMEGLRGLLKKHFKITSKEVKQMPMGRVITATGLVIVKQRPPTAKGVTFFTMEDEFGFIDLILHKHVYERHSEILSSQCFITIKGVVQRNRLAVNVLVEKVSSVWDYCDEIIPLEIEPDQYYW